MLTVQNLNFAYETQQIVKSVNFEMPSRSAVCILGESGSGKSTLLKLIYGELQALSGKITFRGNKVLGKNEQLIAGHQDMKWVSQDFGLESYISVAENVGKHLSNIYLEKKKARIKEVMAALNISDLADRNPFEISGGQQQRVAIARAIASPPQLLLLDEPFSQLDAALHIDIRERLFQFLKRNKIAVLFTSHRADDALGYSDKVLVMKSGEIIQNEKPHLIYQAPKNVDVAGLFGQINVLEAHEAEMLDIQQNFFKTHLVIYPEEIKLSEKGILCRVKFNRFFGSRYEITVYHNGIFLKFYHHKALDIDKKVFVEIKNYRWVL